VGSPDELLPPAAGQLPEVREHVGPVLAALGINQHDDRLASWVGIGLVHSSYLNESPRLTGGGVNREVLACLYSLGTSALDLVSLAWCLEHQPGSDAGSLSKWLAMATPLLLDEVADSMRLPDLALIAKGERSSIANSETSQRNLCRVVARQVAGAMVIGGSLAGLTVALGPLLGLHTRSSIPVDWKTLLQEVLRVPPRYQTAREWGPDHDKRFVVQVVDASGRTADGEGRSKREASMAAAERFVGNFLACEADKRLARTDTAPIYAPSPSILPETHRHTVVQLADTLALTLPDARAMLSRALTHTSWSVEHVRRDGVLPHDLRPLARLGVEVLRLMVDIGALHRVTEGRHRPEEFRLTSVSEQMSLEWEASLRIRPGILLGRGQASAGMRRSIVAEAAQAVAGAAYLASSGRLVTDPPEVLDQWMRIQGARVTEGFVHADFKTALMALITVLGVELTIDLVANGPDHARRFRSTMTFRDSAGATLKVTGREARSRRQADHEAAKSVLAVVLAVNASWSDEVRRLVHDDRFWGAVGSFFLRAEAAAAATLNVRNAGVRRLLGVSLIEAHDLVGLVHWAGDVSELLGPELLHPEAVASFYERAATECLVGHTLTSALQQILAFVDRLSPEHARDIGAAYEHRLLLEVGTVCRLASGPEEVRTLRELLEGWLLVRRSRSPNVVAGSISVGDLCQVEGAFEAMMSSALDYFAETRSDAGTVTVDVFSGEGQIIVSLSRSGETPVQMDPPCGPLWRMLEMILGLGPVELVAGDHGCSLRLTLFRPVPRGGLAAGALSGYSRAALRSVPYPQVLGPALHELKNHLSASEVAAGEPAQGRTGELRRQALVSRHLDQAVSIAEQIRVVAKSSGPTEITAVELRNWIVEYCSDKQLMLPPGIRLVPPRPSPPFTIRTSATLLRSVLDNLVKNAAEALSEGGSIGIDWVGDEETATAVIEVMDDGPGVPSAVREAIKSNQPVASSKKSGWGIGLSAVVATLHRLGGSVELVSTTRGTTWQIELPSHDDVAEDDTALPSPAEFTLQAVAEGAHASQ
jgi:dsRNA-specific ribonuclease